MIYTGLVVSEGSPRCKGMCEVICGVTGALKFL